MAERLAISVVESDDHPEGLEVRDALMQLLDTFALVTASAPSDDIRWCITDVRMNSPLTLITEAVPTRAGVDVILLARKQKIAASQNFAELASGSVPMAWSGPAIRARSMSFLARSRNGIGDTRIAFGITDPNAVFDDTSEVISIDKTVAEAAQVRIDIDNPPALPVKPQIGSVEGTLSGVETYRNKPAFRICERRTKTELWCVVANEHVARIVQHTSFNDVWKHTRVRVVGRITYNAEAQIQRIDATDVVRIQPRHIDIASIGDRNFTGGLGVVEYLERFREGSLG